jgi:hypothetical protein
LEARQYAIQKRAIVDREMQIEYAQQQGEVIGKIEFAQRMLREPATPRAELDNCSVDELQSRLAVLEARLFPAS